MVCKHVGSKAMNAVEPCVQNLSVYCCCCTGWQRHQSQGSKLLPHATVVVAQQYGNVAPVIWKSHGDDIAIRQHRESIEV